MVMPRVKVVEMARCMLSQMKLDLTTLENGILDLYQALRQAQTDL